MKLFSVSLFSVLALALVGCSSDSGSGSSPSGVGSGGSGGTSSGGSGAESSGGSGAATTAGGGGSSGGGAGSGGSGGSGGYQHPVYDPNKFVTANATGSGDGSEQNPWTLAQAMAEAQAGDRVRVGPGVYTGPDTGLRYEPSFYPANDGTDGNPIVFFAQHRAVYSPNDRSEIRCGSTGVGGCPAFGTLNNSHVIWDGFYVDEANSPSTPDTGPVVVWGSDHASIEYCVIENATYDVLDNHNALRIEGVEDITIRNNRFSGTKALVGFSQNYASVMAYDSRRVLVEHNEFDDSDVGIFVKGDHGPGLGEFRIRYNRFTNIRWSAIELGGTKTGSDYAGTEVYQNLVVGSVAGIDLISYDAISPVEVSTHHNTLVDVEQAIVIRGPNGPNVHAGTKVLNNLIVGANAGVQVHITASSLPGYVANGLGSDYNFFDDCAHVGVLETWIGDGGPSYATLSAWQNASGFDMHSTAGSAGFVAAGAGDYHLAAGSAAATASDSGGPVGAFLNEGDLVGVAP